jgi:LPXTG-site transpeptidase (sortase) family protein
MESSDTSTIKKSALRHYGFVMAFAIVGALLIFSPQIKLLFTHQLPVVAHMITGTSATTTESATTTTGLSRLAPVRIQIPSIKLDTTFVPPLTLNADQTVSVPDNYTQVGWYSGGAAPGEVGPAVILGHVDSKAGPAVFYSLGQVKVGDEVQITRTDGSVATFEITDLHRYPQSDFPTLDVYGKTDYPALRLVTCTGIYDHGKQRYSHNLVVYGKLIQ